MEVLGFFYSFQGDLRRQDCQFVWLRPEGLIAVDELASIMEVVSTLTDECQEMECVILLMKKDSKKKH